MKKLRAIINIILSEEYLVLTKTETQTRVLIKRISDEAFEPLGENEPGNVFVGRCATEMLQNSWNESMEESYGD